MGLLSSWLDQHLEEFVRPVLGTIPDVPKDYLAPLNSGEMSVVKNIWRAVKKNSKGLPLLLAGRDVWIFELLARREGFPTTFRPDISRHVVRHVKEDYTGYYLFDTGFAGSIPRGLKMTQYGMVSSASKTGKGLIQAEQAQVFPRMKGSRALALKIEYLPKYWKAGFYRDGMPRLGLNYETYSFVPVNEPVLPKGIYQELSEPEEFKQAAIMTQAIWKDKSPRFVEAVNITRPMGGDFD